MTITQYLGNGAISRGRLTITPQLNTQVATAPYLRNATDKEAVIQGIDTMRAALKNVQGLTWIRPTDGQTTTAFVNSVGATRNFIERMLMGYRSLLFQPRATRTTGPGLTRLARTMDVVAALRLWTSTPRCMEQTTCLS